MGTGILTTPKLVPQLDLYPHLSVENIKRSRKIAFSTFK